MQCYTELVPPSVVSCAVSLPFTSAHAENLVVAKGSLLQVFSTKTVSTEVIDAHQASVTQSTKPPVEAYDRRLHDGDGLDSSFLGGDAMLLRADRTTNTKLVLVAEYPVHGIIRGLARIKIQDSKSGGEALLVHTRVARLSLVQWDPERNGIEDVSIHYYEKDEWQGAPTDGPLRFHGSQLQTDPQSRCAALKFGLRKIAFLPFRQADEDIDMNDWDEDVDGPRPEKESTAAPTGVNGSSSNNITTNHTTTKNTAVPPVPYTSSFVLSLPQLDSDLLHPVHFAFLHEYREPTFGILSSTSRRSNVRRLGDHVSYKVFTIDLHQKASTAILSVNNLPQTLFQVTPLPSPIGGALLVGSNELIHIDQSGKANGVAVNPYAREMTQFPLADQADLQLRLEHCSIELMSAEAGEMLMVLSDGRMAVVSFEMDGRTVAGVAVKLVPAENGGHLLPYQAACMARLGKNSLFVGSIGSDSVVLGWTRRQLQATRKKARLLDDTTLDYDLADGELDGENDDDDDDDDDLYGDDAPTITQSTAAGGTGAAASKGGELSFRIHDSLVSLCPLMDMAPGKPSYLPDSEEAKTSEGVRADLQLACAVGRHKAGSLALLNQNIQPKVIGRFDFPEARGFWTMRVQKPIPKSLQGDKGANLAVGNDYDSGTQYDKFMIVSKVDLDGYETSDVYALTGAGFEALSGTEFDPAAGFTVEAGTMGNDMRIIQVLRSEVRSYDGGMFLGFVLDFFPPYSTHTSSD